MYIEVTEKTFYSVFNTKNYTKTENLELANKNHYWNMILEQNGIIIYNFISNVNQYYLTDINA